MGTNLLHCEIFDDCIQNTVCYKKIIFCLFTLKECLSNLYILSCNKKDQHFNQVLLYQKSELYPLLLEKVVYSILSYQKCFKNITENKKKSHYFSDPCKSSECQHTINQGIFGIIFQVPHQQQHVIWFQKNQCLLRQQQTTNLYRIENSICKYLIS